MRLAVTHRTHYAYTAQVSASYGEVRLFPRHLPYQQVLSSDVVVVPRPTDLRERTDYFGNRCAYFAVLDDHFQLDVTARSVVTVQRRDEPGSGPPWEQVRDAAAAGDGYVATGVREFALDSPLVPTSEGLRELAQASFRSGRPIVEALRDLSARVNESFEFKPGMTSVTTTVDEVLRQKVGVCQDFAHLVIGALRSLGLPARYVSGYLETRPPPGEQRLRGADVSHAWAAAWAGPLGWVEVDPTNDLAVSEHHITTAWGRDYGDVTPLKGVIFTDGPTERPKVEVDVERIADS